MKMIKYKGKMKIPNSNRNWNAIVGNKLTNPYRGSADISPTLTAAMGMGGGQIPMLTNATIQETKTELFMKQVRQSKKKPFVLPKELKGKKFRIRKLTPRECFRLMGVDDADIDKIQNTSLSKSSQYKLAGNSIVVDNLYHLFRKMFIEKEPDKSDKPQQLSLF